MRLAAAAWVAFGLTIAIGSAARANDAVTIGAIYPLSRDGDARLAIETAEEIINNPHQGLAALPLGTGQGLPSLKGAKIAVTFADDLDNPSVAQAEVLHLITRDHVAALIGAGQSPETLAATALTERHGTPFLVPDAIAPSITGRGFKWAFRTSPLASDIARVYVQFLGELKQTGAKIGAVALVFEDSDFGKASSGVLRDALKAAGFNVGDIAYPPNASDLSAPVAQLRTTKPEVAIVISHAADAILLLKTMQTADYKPPILIGDDAGFSDPIFATQVGNLAQGVIDRSVWSAGKPGSPTAIVNNLYKAKSGHDLDDASARVMQGFFVLADAINRAGSSDPAAIQQALQQTDLKPEQLIVGYNGVKFDGSGQNTLASTYLTQLRGKQYVTVWPAANAVGKLVLPFTAWQ
jgi:branched-chain amino acid transport system substrate-binding protein